MYSTPDPTHPHAKPTTNGILSAGISRIAQSHGQRFVAGDWNHDLDPLEAVDSLCALGLVEVQQLYFNAVGVSQRVSSRPSVITSFSVLKFSPSLSNARFIMTCGRIFLEWLPSTFKEAPQSLSILLGPYRFQLTGKCFPRVWLIVVGLCDRLCIRLGSVLWCPCLRALIFIHLVPCPRARRICSDGSCWCAHDAGCRVAA